MMAFAALLRLTQTRMGGGSSVTAHIAEQVNPAIPWTPSVVTMETEEATRDNASRNSPAETCVVCSRIDASIGQFLTAVFRVLVWLSMMLSLRTMDFITILNSRQTLGLLLVT